MIKILPSEGAPKRAPKRALKGPPESGFRPQEGNLRGSSRVAPGPSLTSIFRSVRGKTGHPSR